MGRYLIRAGRVARALSMFACVSLAACGGGGSSGSAGGPGVSTSPRIPHGTVAVTATDAFGAPVVGAEVSVYMDGGNTWGRTDRNGYVEIPGIRAGTISVHAGYHDAAGGPLNGSAQTTIREDERLAVALTLVPNPDLPFVGVGPSARHVQLDPDGRALEFSLPLFLSVDDPAWEWTGGGIRRLQPGPGQR
jgi:hypothetical protein